MMATPYQQTPDFFATVRLARRQKIAEILTSLMAGQNEWTGQPDRSAGLHCIVTGDTRRPGKLAVRRYDASGFGSHQEVDDQEGAAEYLYLLFGMGAEMAAGSLERLAMGWRFA